MKRLASLTLALLIGSWLTVAPALAQKLPAKVHQFDGTLPDGTAIQVIWVPKNGKVGVITWDAKGEPTSAYIFFQRENASERFYRTAANTFGQVDKELFVYFELSALEGDSISIEFDGGESQLLSGREPVSTDSLAPFGNCTNYCYPSDPTKYNWYQCFWCCATTGTNPC